MLVLVSAALAQSDTGVSCAAPEVTGRVPADGAVGVPTDAQVLLLVNEDALPCGVAVAIADDRGAVLDADVAVDEEAALVRIVPRGLEADRTYTVVATFANGEIVTHFSTTSDPPPPPPPPSDPRVELFATCETVMVTRAYASADPAPGSVGMFALAVDGADVAYGAADEFTALEATVAGASDPCATLRLYDVSGRVAWESAPTCLSYECPVPPALAVAFDVQAERTCGSAERTHAVVLLRLPEDPIEAGGSWFVTLETERETVRSAPSPWIPGSGPSVELVALGTHAACVAVTYVDVGGAEVWTTDALCVDGGIDCAWADDLDGVDDDRGCGCAGSSGSGAVGLLALLLRGGRSGRRPARTPRRSPR